MGPEAAGACASAGAQSGLCAPLHREPVGERRGAVQRIVGRWLELAVFDASADCRARCATAGDAGEHALTADPARLVSAELAAEEPARSRRPALWGLAPGTWRLAGRRVSRGERKRPGISPPESESRSAVSRAATIAAGGHYRGAPRLLVFTQ